MGIFSKKTDKTPSVEPVVTETKPTVTVSVLVQPVITEKSTKNGTYVFKVNNATTKNEIRKAFKKQYGKEPRKVNIVNVMGKTKIRGRIVGKRQNWKKAIVYLVKGETVEINQK
ncbi:MAG: 50S ribosomal protein L23 [Patescibacteria group bacterium]|jgi:large subunit ribosomal protein L23